MKNSRIAKLIGIGILVIGMFGSVFGQQHTENKADQTLRGSGRVNPSTLGMEFDLPLGSYSGRGINVPIGLSYSSKVWRMDYVESFPAINNTNVCHSEHNAVYSENSASGWTNSLAVPYIEYLGAKTLLNSDGFPSGSGCPSGVPSPTSLGRWYIKKIVVHLPSGETHELRADEVVGSFPNSGDISGLFDGVFYAVDGSNIKYTENTNSGLYVLQLPDGSRYNFNGSISAIGRKATNYTDRNGNFTTFNDTNGTWTDTLGRTIAQPFGLSAPTVPNVQTYTMLGLSGGNPLAYKFYWKKLKDTTAAESALTDFNLSLKYKADNFRFAPRTAGTFLFKSDTSPVNKDYVSDNGELFNPIVLTEIELPTGQKYKFRYSIYGVIEEIEYPTGGAEKFQYMWGQHGVSTSTIFNEQTNAGVTKREVYEKAGQGVPYTWTYGFSPNPDAYRVFTQNPDGTKTERDLYTGYAPCVGCPSDYGYDNALAGMAYAERSFDSAGQIVSKKLTNWTVTATPFYGRVPPHSNPRVTSEESIIYDTSGNGISTTSTIEYEGDLSQRDTPLLTKKSSQYKFVTVGSALPAFPERTSETQYLQSDPNILQSTKDAYKAQNMVGLATNSVVKDANNNIVSRSEMAYDEAIYSPNIGRGNPTTSRVWDSTKGNHDNPSAYIGTHAKFDIYGNQIESTDAKGNVSTTEYSALYNYAFPTKVTTPIPSDGVSGSNTAFITTVVYDPTTGLPTSTTDANGLESRIEYDPTTLRPIRTKNYFQNSQVGGTSETIYNDTLGNIWVKSRTQIDETNWAESITYSDGLGRAFKSEKLDSGGSIFTETEFDSVGRPKRSTNPYRANEAKVWTTTNYDSQSRPFEIVTSDGAKVTTAFGLSTTGTHVGTTVTVTDQANKQRRSITNALGQLTRVDEPNDAGQLDVNGVPAQSTNYIYDTLNNLITVNQGVQTRTFQYDSLSRLKQANNPESGIINYLYDNNSNLTSKTDARQITTNYVYDNLNRVKTRSYQNEPTGQTTPNVSYTYDNLPNAKGKLIKVNSSVSTTEYTSFDILGRVLNHKQRTDNNDYTTAYTYNLSGALIEETYPSGRVVKNTLDQDGDLQQVQSKRNADTFKNYANAFTYTSAGAVSSLRLGNGKFENTTFNSRLQPIQIGLGSSATSQNLLKLNFEYGGDDNNGNVKSQQITVPTVGTNQGFVATQIYAYDSLNRLKSAVETIPNQTGWKQTFKFDRYGNRTFDTANGNTTTLANGCPVNICNPTANPNDNKLVGTNYDSVGNTSQDANGQTFVYDAENKQVQVSNATGIVGIYAYDFDGKRIKKHVPSTGETTIFVYDAGGDLVAEYSTIVANQAEAKVSYLTNDHLGSPRITTDSTGKVISRRDFMPLGEEIPRASYGSDSVRQKFTGYERDSETGLDYAKARMFGSGVGRFTSPDPLMASANPISPQSWNRYTYSYNNPLRFTDPSGMIAGDFYNTDGKKIGTDGVDDKKIYIVLDKDKAKEIEKSKDKFTGTVDSKITIANASVISAIGDAVTRSNDATYNTSSLPELGKTEKATGCFREAGVTWTTTDGNTNVTVAPDGDYSDPRIPNGTATISLPSEVDGKAHIHPSGEIVKTETSGNNSGGGVMVIGGESTKTSTANFKQHPSPVDISNATGGTNIVVGAGNKTVYFYNSGGTMKTTMKLSNFLKIGK